METLSFLLKVNIVFALLFLAYRSLLRNTAFFQANRVWLLLSPVVAFILPLVRLPSSVQVTGVGEWLPLSVGAAGSGTAASAGISPMDAVSMVYQAGVLVSLLILIVRYVQAWRVSRRSDGEALSFFGRIVLPAGLDGDELRSLTAHERVHAVRHHSLDVLYFELFAALSWWNPIWRWALRELRTVHELQADAVASTLHPDYGRLLLSRALGTPVSTLVNSFRSSNLKTRITMLNAPIPRYAGLKYILAIPFLAAAMLIVSCDRSIDPVGPSESVMNLNEVDVQPEFPGGMGVMYAFLHRTIHYPEQALTDKLQGKVFVQFTVGSDGHVRDVVIRRGVRKDLDDEALRGIRAMPDWVPGEKDGHAVATRFIVPVSFTLDRTESPAKE